MSQNSNHRLIEKQNNIYARERGDIEVLKEMDKIEESERIIHERIDQLSELRRENNHAASTIDDLQKRIKLAQEQSSEKTEQIENQRILFEAKSAELEDVKVKLPQARSRLEFDMKTEEKRILERLKQLYEDHNFTTEQIKLFQEMIPIQSNLPIQSELSSDHQENDQDRFVKFSELMILYRQELVKYNEHQKTVDTTDTEGTMIQNINSTTMQLMYGGKDDTLHGIPSCSQAENIYIHSHNALPTRMQSTPMKPITNPALTLSIEDPNMTTIMEHSELGTTPVAIIDVTENFHSDQTETISTIKPEPVQPDFDDDFGTQFFATVDLTVSDEEMETDHEKRVTNDDFKWEAREQFGFLNDSSQQFTQLEQSQSPVPSESQTSQTLQQSLSEATNRFSQMQKFFSSLTK